MAVADPDHELTGEGGRGGGGVAWPAGFFYFSVFLSKVRGGLAPPIDTPLGRLGQIHFTSEPVKQHII